MSGYFKDCMYVPILTVVYSVYLFIMNAPLAVICLFPLEVMVPLNVKLLKPIKLRQFQYAKELGLTNNNVEEAFAGAEVIKSYNLQKKMMDRYEVALYKTFKTSNENDLAQYNLEPISRAIQEVPMAIAICVGGVLVFNNAITMGVLIAYISTIKKLIEPLSRCYQLVVRSQTALVSVSRVFEVIDIQPEKNVLTGASNYNDMADSPIISFRDVTFGYGQENVLVNVSFNVRKGERIAFVGESGSGKSTIIKLISRQISMEKEKIFYLGSFGTIIAGAVLVSEGTLDFGTVMAVVTLQMSVSNAMQRLGGSISALTTSMVRASHVFDFMELDMEEQINWFTGEKSGKRFLLRQRRRMLTSLLNICRMDIIQK